MKKALVFLLVFVVLSLSTIDTTALVDKRIYRDLEEDQYYNLNTAIHCYYDCGTWISNGWSSTECETTSDMFCYVWAKNIDRNGVETFKDISGYTSGRLVLPLISVSSTRYARETWHGAYRTKNGIRNLDARVEIISTTP